MPDEITSNPEPTNIPAPQAPETTISMPAEAVVTPTSVETPIESVPVSEPIPEESTAQMGGNEPFAPTSETPEVLPTEVALPTPAEQVIETTPTPSPTQVIATVVTPVIATTITQTFTKSIRELFTKAQLTIQNRKRKKLDRILSLFAKQTMITNNEVEKLLHVSDATATRYLSTLEKEGKIKQNKKTGKGVTYSKI